MKKLYTIIAVMMMMPAMAFAWSFDLLDENPVLQGADYNLKLTKNYNFFNATFNGENMVDEDGNRITGDGCLVFSPDKASIKLNKNDVFQVVAPVCMKNFFMQGGGGAINMRANINRDGLHNYGSGPRYFAISDVKAGQVIVCQWGMSQSSNVVQPSNLISGATACEWTDISEEVHAAQAAEIDEETGEPKTPDTFSYWKVETDGFFVIEIQRYGCVLGLQIWTDANAKEYVTSPSFAVSKVDLDTRYGKVIEGESSEGNAVTTWYSLDGSDPIFLKETDEVESEEIVYTYDEEGNVIDEQTVYTYKKVLDPIEDGIYGEIQYFEEDGISFDSTVDEDGDGYVTIKMATVSETGNAYSDIVEYRISVQPVTLNPPTLTLVGINGFERTYQIGWTNNTLCHEEFSFNAEVDGESYEGLALGDVITAQSDVKVTVVAAGYYDGVYELAEVLNKGVNMYRKNQEKAEQGLHDWDYVLTDEDVKDKVTGKEIAYCYIEGAEDVHYTKEEYENGEAADGTDLSGAIVVYADYGWDWDGGNARATLRVLKTEVEPDVWEPVEGGYDFNEAGFGYHPDVLGLVSRDGLNISCPPNTKNNSCILQYVDRADGDGSLLGIYFMARPTLTFERNAAEYGDFVLVYQGQGGSNYTNNRWPSVHEVPADQLLTFQLANNGVHLFYIDIYTSDKPEDYEDPYVTGIETVKKQNINNGFVYTIDGRIVNRNADLNGLQRGLYILNGKKVIIK